MGFFSWQLGLPGADHQLIKPGERRTIETPMPEGRELGPATLQLAAFADGHIEGVPEVVERWQR